MIDKTDGFDLHLTWTIPEKRIYAFTFIILFLSILVIYGNSVNGIWVFDDEPNIVDNKYVHLKTVDWDNIHQTFYGIDRKGISRPFAYLTFGLNYYFGQLNPFGYHVVNLIIHLLSSIFLFLFIHHTLNLSRLKVEYGSSSYAIALLSTFFWTFNPVQVTAVTYIVQRMTSMAGMFYIMSMFFYLRGRTNDKLSKMIFLYILSVISGVLAIGTKENAAMLPVSIYIYDLLLIQEVTKENIIKNLKYVLLPVTIVAFGVIVLFVDASEFLRLKDYAIRPFSMWERVLTETRVIVFYISLLLYPVSSRLMLNHDFILSKSLFYPWTTIAAVLFILGCLGLAIATARKKPLICFCISFFFINHLIEGTIIPLELIFEHTNYTPSMFFFLPFVIFAIRVLDYFSYKKVIQMMTAMLISFLLFAQGHTVYMYNDLFKESYFLWSDNAAKAPNLSRPHNNVGTALSEMGLYDEAYISYEKAYHLNRSDHLGMITAPINNIGLYYFRKKDFNTAIFYFTKAIEIYPNDSKAQLMFAKTKVQMNDMQSAEITTRQALAKWSDNTELHALLSFILLKIGNYDGAIKEAWKTIIICNEFSYVNRVLAEAYRRTGRIDRAVRHWEDYTSRYKGEIEGYLALIELYSKTGETEKLNRTIAKAMILKGPKSWRETMKEYTAELASHAYEPDVELLLGIIKRNLVKGI